jgi:hypothetical protein
MRDDRPGTGRSLIAALAAAAAAAPLGGAAGGVLCAAIQWLAGLARGAPSFDPDLALHGLRVGAWPLAAAVPAALLAAHLAGRRLPSARYGAAIGWTGFAAGGAVPYLSVPGYDALPLGLVAGMACAWAFAQAGGRVSDARAVDGGRPDLARTPPPGP